MRKEHKKNNPEKTKEANERYRLKTHFCEICNYEIKQYKKSQHEKSQTHQNNLKQQSQEPEHTDKPLQTQMHKLKPLIPYFFYQHNLARQIATEIMT